jgi:hypothetical protein
VVVLPLQFLSTHNSVGKATAAKNTMLKWFELHYFHLDIFYFVQFAWVGILSIWPEKRSLCGCWCSAVIELNVGWSCVLPLFFMNSALSTLINMVYKEREKTMSCTKACRMLTGFSQISKLYGARSREFAAASSRNNDNLFRFRVLHMSSMVAAYSAVILTTLIALSSLRFTPGTYVRGVMDMSHAFCILIVLTISGTNLPCRRGSICRPSQGLSKPLRSLHSRQDSANTLDRLESTRSVCGGIPGPPELPGPPKLLGGVQVGRVNREAKVGKNLPAVGLTE